MHQPNGLQGPDLPRGCRRTERDLPEPRNILARSVPREAIGRLCISKTQSRSWPPRPSAGAASSADRAGHWCGGRRRVQMCWSGPSSSRIRCLFALRAPPYRGWRTAGRVATSSNKPTGWCGQPDRRAGRAARSTSRHVLIGRNAPIAFLMDGGVRLRKGPADLGQATSVGKSWQFVTSAPMCVYRHFSIRVARASHIEGIPTRTMRVADWRNVMAVGTVKWFNTQKGYGFLQPDDGSRDVFVHISAVERAGMTQLKARRSSTKFTWTTGQVFRRKSAARVNPSPRH